MFAILQRRLAVSGLLGGLALATALLLGQPLHGGPGAAPAIAGAAEAGAALRVQDDAAAGPARQRARDLAWPFFSFARSGARRSW